MSGCCCSEARCRMCTLAQEVGLGPSTSSPHKEDTNTLWRITSGICPWHSHTWQHQAIPAIKWSSVVLSHNIGYIKWCETLKSRLMGRSGSMWILNNSAWCLNKKNTQCHALMNCSISYPQLALFNAGLKNGHCQISLTPISLEKCLFPLFLHYTNLSLFRLHCFDSKQHFSVSWTEYSGCTAHMPLPISWP